MDTNLVTCTRRLTFCAGHRLVEHEGKCRHLHGHNYVVEVTAQAPLDSVGRVVDFSVLKDRVGGWIEEQWDHKFILNEADPYAEWFIGKGEPVYLLPANPTAEHIANFLLEVVCPDLLGDICDVVHVRVWETENCTAEAMVL